MPATIVTTLWPSGRRRGCNPTARGFDSPQRLYIDAEGYTNCEVGGPENRCMRREPLSGLKSLAFRHKLHGGRSSKAEHCAVDAGTRDRYPPVTPGYAGVMFNSSMAAFQAARTDANPVARLN